MPLSHLRQHCGQILFSIHLQHASTFLLRSGLPIRGTKAKMATARATASAYEAQLQLAKNYKLNGEYAEAIQALGVAKSLTEQTDTVDVLMGRWRVVQEHISLADSLIGEGALEDALVEIEKAQAVEDDRYIQGQVDRTQSDITEFDNLLSSARRAIDAQQTELAIGYLDNALAIRPHDSDAVRLRASLDN